ncbi:uncharacterized protein Dmoj_GI26691 [Drosophila mojavensis]|uniref:Uncharacterized protein n=1 Tax=Drosophila mojavensis TaxID=7230 RepID=A0A0Q9WN27_DROMO|nr:uncharacterized protein Dmoj_GI26691 [Drosophila mojavensis]
MSSQISWTLFNRQPRQIGKRECCQALRTNGIVFQLPAASSLVDQSIEHNSDWSLVLKE